MLITTTLNNIFNCASIFLIQKINNLNISKKIPTELQVVAPTLIEIMSNAMSKQINKKIASKII